MDRRKEVTLEHIAAEVGASIVTVSNALKGKKGVSEELRRTICETAGRLGYRTGEKAGKKSYHIGVAVAECYVKEFPSFYMEIYQRAAQELTMRGSMAFLKVISEELGENMMFFPGVEIDGILLIGEMSKGYAADLKKIYQVPVVCLGSYDISEEIDYVAVDYFGGMEQITELLLDAGHRDLFYVGTPESGGNAMDRYLGYCKALEKRGLAAGEDRILRQFRPRDGRSTEEVHLPAALPDAFVCESAQCAALLMEILQEQGVHVPEDVSVAGVGRCFVSPHSVWKLTTYDNDEKVIAHIGVSILVKRLEGHQKMMGVRVVEGKIVQGSTVKKAGQALWQM